jgi:hypothetical protein
MAARLREQGGWTMLTATMTTFAAMSLSAGTLTYVSNDAQLQRHDRWTKRALLALQTGVSDYTQHLAVDSNYFTYCDQMTGTHAVNDTDIGETAGGGSNSPVNSAGKILRRWVPDPDLDATYSHQTLKFQYTIDLLPANNQPSCKELTDRVATMVDSTQATFRIRITGRAGPAIPSGSTITYDKQGNSGANNALNRERYRKNFWTRRTVVIDYRRRGFLDFAWLTDNESKDPALYSNPSWAETNCSMWFRDGRDGNGCTEINFVNGDWIKGPFHTNDSILAQTGSKFGRSGGNDRIEISASWCPVRNTDTSSGCGASSPIYYGPLITGVNAPVLPLPEANEDLATYGDPSFGGYTFTGWTTIEMKNNGTMDVTNANYNGGALTNVPYPTSGVVYVKNGTGCDGYNPNTGWNPTGDATCGLIAVNGVYNKSLTLAAEDDIVVTGNITRDTAPAASEEVLGMIANKFVRVRHYATGSYSSCSNYGTPVSTIEGGILALQHSFMLDWWGCGSSLGTLTIKGAIAQKYRGVIGTGSGSTGYLKDYNYDDKLRYRMPPYFLSPAYSGWRTVRFREQVPACLCDENSTLLP